MTGKKIYQRLTTLSFLVPLTALPAISIAGEPEDVPLELMMVINPGSNDNKTIRFATDGESLAVEQKATQSMPAARASSYAGDADSGGAKATYLPDQETNENDPFVLVAQPGNEDPGEDEKKAISTTTSIEPAEDHKQEPEKKQKDWKIPKYAAYEPSLALRAGYRQDSANFSIAGPDNQPNILSELTWDKIQSFNLGGTFRWSNASHFYLRGSFDYGLVVTGESQDSDYLDDDRTYEFSRSYADVEEGNMFDGSIGAGFRLDLPFSSRGGRFHLIPLVGYAYHSQLYEMTNGRQVIADYGFGVPLGPFEGLQSRYESVWDGLWLGLDLELHFNDRHALLGSFEYLWADYDGEGEWNLRTDLQQPTSFDHDADGQGITASLNYQYRFTDRWTWSLGFWYQDFSTDPGRHQAFFSNGTSNWLRLNEVEWESYSVMLGFTYHF